MNAEANPIYKVLRSLWFPMSVNAAALGAIAVVVFRATSLLAAWAFEDGGRPWEADSRFDDALTTLALGGLPALGEARRVVGGSAGVLAVQFATAYVLWATVGVAMCRTLAVRIARDEYVPLKAAWSFAWRTKATALLWLPAISLPVAFCGAVVAAIGAASAIPYLGWTASALLLPVTAIFAVVMQIIWFGGLATLGFVPAAIASERRGTYDAVCKAFHYVFARPLPAVLYLATLGAFLWVLESAVFDPDRLKQAVARTAGLLLSDDATLRRVLVGDTDGTEGYAKACAWLHRLVFGGVDALVRGAFLSWAAGGFTALFLMFRQECDGNDLSDVCKDDA